MIRYEGKDGVPVDQSKCHPVFIPKYSRVTNITGGCIRLVLLGGVFAASPQVAFLLLFSSTIASTIGIDKLPGFTNCDEVCPVCGLSPGSDGCSTVGEEVEIQEKGSIKTLHEIKMNTIVMEA